MIAHYIIFHPKRHESNEYVEVLRNNVIHKRNRKILIDKKKYGLENEDPFVFSDPWIYSYCHATTLKRVPQSIYVQEGSYLIFTDGSRADDGYLKIDTIFLVDNVLTWSIIGNSPPTKYSITNITWDRHIKHGIKAKNIKGHKGRYTYEAKMHNNADDKYSFLPLFKEKEYEIDMQFLTRNLRLKIKGKLKGKIPVLINSRQAQQILNIIDQNVKEKVIRII